MAISKNVAPAELFLAACQPALTASGDRGWDKRFADWLRCAALTRAHENFGPSAAVYEASDLKELELEQRFGKGWRSIPAAMEEYGPVYHDVREVDNSIARNYYEPQDRAAVALALQPAPNLPAALFKIAVIDLEGLNGYLPLTEELEERTLFEIVREDMARVAATP